MAYIAEALCPIGQHCDDLQVRQGCIGGHGWLSLSLQVLDAEVSMRAVSPGQSQSWKQTQNSHAGRQPYREAGAIQFAMLDADSAVTVGKSTLACQATLMSTPAFRGHLQLPWAPRCELRHRRCNYMLLRPRRCLQADVAWIALGDFLLSLSWRELCSIPVPAARASPVNCVPASILHVSFLTRGKL